MNFNTNLLVSTLGNLPGIIEMYVSNIPNDKLDIKRNKGTWTNKEHVYHLASVHKILYNRIELIEDTKNPIIKPFFPDREISIIDLYNSVEDAFIEYKTERKNQIDVISKLNNDHFQNEANHGEYSIYNIPIIMNHIIFHEYWHMYRIEEIWLTKDEYFN